MLECKGLNEYLNEYNRFSAQGAYLLFTPRGRAVIWNRVLYIKDSAFITFCTSREDSNLKQGTLY